MNQKFFVATSASMLHQFIILQCGPKRPGGGNKAKVRLPVSSPEAQVQLTYSHVCKGPKAQQARGLQDSLAQHTGIPMRQHVWQHPAAVEPRKVLHIETDAIRLVRL